MLYRKKPVVIDARQLLMTQPICDGCTLSDWIQDNGGKATCDGLNLYINTLEGQMKADPNDWIIQGVKGEFYPCKPDIFATTYEPVE